MKHNKRYTIEFEVNFLGGRCFYGAGVGGFNTDRTFVRGKSNEILISGAHIKGITRNRCEELCAILGDMSDDLHHLHYQKYRQNTLHIPSSIKEHLISRIFGYHGGTELTCIFSDLIIKQEEAYTHRRSRIRINRRLGRPENKALFDTEYAVPFERSVIKGNVVGWFATNDNRPPPELTLLCAGLRMINSIGGDKSTGAGEVELKIVEITCDMQSLSLDEILAPIKNNTWLRDLKGGAA